MQFKGKSVVSGSASGILHIVADINLSVTDQRVCDRKKELQLAERAKEKADHVLKLRYEKAKEVLGLCIASIVEGHRYLLSDPSLMLQIKELILDQGFCAKDAVAMAGKNRIQEFRQMKDPYMRARSNDLYDITCCWMNAVCDCLNDEKIKSSVAKEHTDKGNKEVVNDRNIQGILLYGTDITVSDVLNYDFKCLRGILCEEGSEESHTAVIAATLNLPMLIELRALNSEFKSLNSHLNGHIAHIQSETGTLIIEDTARHSE